jgi:hypothetical protein
MYDFWLWMLDVLLEVYDRVGLTNVLAVSNMQRNGFIVHPTTRKNIDGSEVSIFLV